MELNTRERYLDLLKKTLSFTLWPEPPAPLDRGNHSRPPVRRALIALASRLLRPLNLQLSLIHACSDKQRREGMIWPQYADTMIGLKRLDNLQECVETVLRDNVPGDLIETGVWRGGACIFMRAVLAAHGDTHRQVFVADSFRGLPKPDAATYPADKGDCFYLDTLLLGVSRAQVEENFRRYNLLDDRVVFLEGWFKDTLPAAPIERLAVMRLDGDMYESTMDALVNLYPKLSPGGFCIVDDYELHNCRKAVEDFRARHQIKAELHTIDWTGRYWRKDAAQ